MKSEITYNHSIYFDQTRCSGDMACMKVCPVGAIRMKDGKAIMLDDKCIDCGECVKVCKVNAIVPLTNTFKDFSNFKYTVAIPSLALYSQFDRQIKPKTILYSLEYIGFDEVFDITRACNAVLKVLSKYIKEYTGRKPLLSSFCPTCVKIIQIKYPELISRLVPIISPIELSAIYARKEISKRMKIDPGEIGVIYITPCPSKMILISQKTDKQYSVFDGAIPISEIYNPLYTAIQHVLKEKSDEAGYYDISGYGLNFAKADGLRYMMDSENNITVSGINNVLHILDEIEKGKLHNVDFIEMHSCPEGCLGGPMVIENAYIARTNLKNLINYYGETKIPIGKKDIFENYDMKNENMFHNGTNNDIHIDIKLALQKLSDKKRYLAKLPKIDCGACGSPNCDAFAEDVANNKAGILECLILENKKLKKMLENLNSEDSQE